MTYTIPDLFITSWQSLTAKQAYTVADSYYRMKECHKQQLWKAYGHCAIQILAVLMKKRKVVQKITADQAVDIINDLSFLGEKWTSFHVQAKGDLQSPGERMHDCIFDQLVYADTYFTKYLEDVDAPDDLLLDKLVACLYLPAGVNKAAFFKPEEIQDRATDLTNRFDRWEKLLIFHTYANIRETIMARCPDLFPKPPKKGEEDPEQTEKKKEIKNTGGMWLNIRYDLAETNVFRGIHTARTANIYQALDYLEKKAREYNEQQRKQKK